MAALLIAGSMIWGGPLFGLPVLNHLQRGNEAREMLFSKLNQRAGGPEIAGAVRLEPDNPNNAVIVPPLPFAPDNFSGIEEKFSALFLRGARGLALENGFAISMQVDKPLHQPGALADPAKESSRRVFIAGLGGHGLRVARPALSPSQSVALGIKRTLAPHFGNGRPFTPRGRTKLVESAIADGISRAREKLFGCEQVINLG